MPNYVANKIGIGATRNLVIRGVHGNITAQRLRDDLDHIHNLIVINVTFQNHDVYLSLNSIHNALFARTCMMSRAAYKGMKIEWVSDECALPLPKGQASPSRREGLQPTMKKPDPLANRFHMLNMDGTEDGTDPDSSEEGGDDPSVFTGFVPLDHRSRWDDRSIAA